MIRFRTLVALVALCPLAAFAADRHLFLFGGNVPASFAASARAAGGSVTSQHTAAGIAVVSGLTESEAQNLAASSGAGPPQLRLRPGRISIILRAWWGSARRPALPAAKVGLRGLSAPRVHAADVSRPVCPCV